MHMGNSRCEKEEAPPQVRFFEPLRLLFSRRHGPCAPDRPPDVPRLRFLYKEGFRSGGAPQEA